MHSWQNSPTSTSQQSFRSSLSAARRCHKKAWREPNRRKSVFHNRIMWISWFSSCGFSNTWRCDWIHERETLNSILLLRVCHVSIITTFVVLSGPNHDANWTSVCGQISHLSTCFGNITATHLNMERPAHLLHNLNLWWAKAYKKIEDVNASGRQCQPGEGKTFHFSR